jgi:cell wall-associated NlpC family hydrolase
MSGADTKSLLNRLLADPEFRDRFEADPVGTARAAGFDALADELARDDDDPMQTLELRESRSSLAGAFMAAAVEGLGAFELGGHVFAADEAHAASEPTPVEPVGEPNAAVVPVNAGAVARLDAPAEQVAGQRLEAPIAPPPDVAPAVVAVPAPSVDPDDLQGDLDDEDAGDDEVDGSDENEPDEGGGEDEEGDEGGDDDGGSDDGVDEPGEGSNGEDANDDNVGDSGSDDSDNSPPNPSNPSTPESPDDSDDDNSSDSSNGSDSSDGSDSGGDLDFDSFDAYPGDDAPKEQIAGWMAAAAEKRGLPPELPVMASLVESGLQNHPYGDADSVGLFQMRTSVWNEGAYQGYPDDPELQLKWFLDRAEAVKNQRLAPGRSVDDPRQYGDWIADVERPAERYRGRYQLRLDEARALLEQAGASSSASESSNRNDALSFPAVDPNDLAGGSSAAIAHLQVAVVETAKTQLGIPYQWGGEAKLGSPTDCSGLLQAVLAKYGIDIPRVTYDQFKAGRAVSREDLQPGDAVFFDMGSRGPEHVGIYIGGNRMIEDPHTGAAVRVSDLSGRSDFAGARRYLQIADVDSRRDYAGARRYVGG